MLIEHAAADAGAQRPLAHLGLHCSHRRRSQPGDLVKHDARCRVRDVGSRADHIDNAAVEAEVRVQCRAEAVDEDHRPRRTAALLSGLRSRGQRPIARSRMRTATPGRSAAARSSNDCRCDARVGPWRRLLARRHGAHRGCRAHGSGTAAALLCPPAVRSRPFCSCEGRPRRAVEEGDGPLCGDGKCPSNVWDGSLCKALHSGQFPPLLRLSDIASTKTSEVQCCARFSQFGPPEPLSSRRSVNE